MKVEEFILISSHFSNILFTIFTEPYSVTASGSEQPDLGLEKSLDPSPMNSWLVCIYPVYNIRRYNFLLFLGEAEANVAATSLSGFLSMLLMRLGKTILFSFCMSQIS